jgi:hypothetical protein
MKHEQLKAGEQFDQGQFSAMRAIPILLKVLLLFLALHAFFFALYFGIYKYN